MADVDVPEEDFIPDYEETSDTETAAEETNQVAETTKKDVSFCTN